MPALSFVDALEHDLERVAADLLDTSTVTVTRALAVVNDCAAQIQSNLELLRVHEAPRQRMVQAERERRQAEAKREADRLAAEKQARISARLARRAVFTPKGKSK